MNILDIWYSVDPMKPSHFNISVVMDKKVGANPGKPQLKVELQFRSLSNRDCSVGLFSFDAARMSRDVGTLRQVM